MTLLKDITQCIRSKARTSDPLSQEEHSTTEPQALLILLIHQNSLLGVGMANAFP